MRHIPVLKMPEYLRTTLSMPQGTLYISSHGLVKGITADYAVGDYVSMTLNYRINAIDYKTRRKRRVNAKVDEENTIIINPPGTLSIMSKTMLKAKKISTYIVVGEEDLLPVGIGLERKGTIVYGQPGIGVVKLVSSRLKSQRILKTFKPAIHFL
jgi:uncharacterized protein (UPF0218 family)